MLGIVVGWNIPRYAPMGWDWHTRTSWCRIIHGGTCMYSTKSIGLIEEKITASSEYG